VCALGGRSSMRDAHTVFVADDLGAWLVGVLADASRKKLIKLFLGDEQKRALRSAATSAVQLTATGLLPGRADEAEGLAIIVSEVFREPVPIKPLTEDATILAALQAGVARQLAVLGDAELTGVGRSSADLLGIRVGKLSQSLADHLVREIMAQGAVGGPLEPLAAQLNHELTRLQGQQIEHKIDRVAEGLSRISPPDRDAMLLGAARMVQHQIASRQNAEPERHLFIMSQVRRVCERFSDIDWRRDCYSNAQGLTAFLRGERELSYLADSLDGIDWAMTFEALRGALRALPLRDAEKRLATWAVRVPDSEFGRDRRVAINRAQASIRWLIGQSLDPRFRSCLPITGSWGSGKTRLLTEVAEWQRDQGQLVVFLAPGFSGSLRDELLDRSAELLGWRETDVASLSRRLRTDLGKRLLVLFDDFGEAVARRPGVLGAAADLISECTGDDAIRWVVTADYLHLDDLLESGSSEFWLHYGYYAEKGQHPGIGGWLFLDDINIKEQVGLRLLQDGADDQNRADLSEIRRDVGSFDYEARSLCNPLPAWLRLELPEEGLSPGLLNVYIERFASAYWKQRKAVLASDKHQAERFEALVTLLSHRFANLPGSRVTLDDLVGDASQSPRLARDVIDDIDALVAGGVLDRPTADYSEVPLRPEVLSPRLGILWGYRIGRALGRDPGGDVQAADIFAALRPWGINARSGGWVAEAVTEFGLALLPWEGARARVTRSVWKSWYQDPDLPLHPLFLAGVSIPNAGQAQLREWLKDTPPQIIRKRELFLLLRLLALAGTSDWPTPGRLRAVQGHYRLIGASGLGMYLTYVVSALLARGDITTGQNYASVLSCLAGSEDSGVAALIADSTVEAGWGIFGDDAFALLTNVTKFLKRSTDPAHAQDFPQRPAPAAAAAALEAAGDPNSAPAYFFWQNLVRAVARTLVERRGIDAFDDFARVGWFSGTANGIKRHVALRMRQEANVALGAAFRARQNEASNMPRQRFIRLVDRLAQGQELELPRIQQQEIAFYLIRHTTVTGGRPAVLIDESLRPVLRALCHDPRVRSSLHGATPTCALNGCMECAKEIADRRSAHPASSLGSGDLPAPG
jgi:hypothetical protein